MQIVYQIHTLFGERILPLLIVLAAIWFTIAWKPNQPPLLAARLFPFLVYLQFILGLIWWIYGIVVVPGVAERYLSFPFVLHPVLGLVAAAAARLSVRPRGFVSNLGRWAPLASLAVLLVLILGNVALASLAA